jgi:uncharacterized protein with NAD-binding domain and iron-sulfur cluster
MAAAGQRKTKIAVLGGGMGSLAAVFHLSSQEDWQSRYEISVYQLGWRLGGKGASGRNEAEHQRIEEHGLHIWPGFYYNAFRLMRQCYRELNRDRRTCPIASWQDGFKKQHAIMDMEKVGCRREPWALEAPGNGSTPGVGGRWPTPIDYACMALKMLFAHVFRSAYAAHKTSARRGEKTGSWWRRLKHTVRGHLEMSLLLVGALVVGNVHRRRQRRRVGRQHATLLGRLERYQARLNTRLARWLRGDEDARRFWVVVDLVLAGLRGIVHDGLFRHGFDGIDDLDFRAWLRRHGASEWAVESALIHGLYDFLFAYPEGNPRNRSLAAGVGLRLCVRLAYGYKGAILWKMQAGMGDIVFAPLYEVLRRRGVQFHFFQRVEHLGLSADSRSVERIVLGRQATLRHSEYKPLVYVNGLPCWPNEPRYDQLVEGAALQEGHVNLESQWTAWQDVEEVTLQAGRDSEEGDFDLVVLGLSLSALPAVAGELIARSTRWRQMIEGVQTVRTVSAQLWMKPRLAALGWDLPSPILSAFADPLETWADMSQTLRHEGWPETVRPGSVSYFCGPWPDGAQPVPLSDHGYPAREHAQAVGVVEGWLQKEIGSLWPQAVTPAPPHGMNWDLLVAPKESIGADRLRHQFCKVNIEPSDRYVLSAAGTTRHRLAVDESGLTNLYLVGDWVRNGLNFGCIESAVVSGLQVCRALTGQPHVILGETDW